MERWTETNAAGQSLSARIINVHDYTRENIVDVTGLVNVPSSSLFLQGSVPVQIIGAHRRHRRRRQTFLPYPSLCLWSLVLASFRFLLPCLPRPLRTCVETSVSTRAYVHIRVDRDRRTHTQSHRVKLHRSFADATCRCAPSGCKLFSKLSRGCGVRRDLANRSARRRERMRQREYVTAEAAVNVVRPHNDVTRFVHVLSLRTCFSTSFVEKHAAPTVIYWVPNSNEIDDGHTTD